MSAADRPFLPGSAPLLVVGRERELGVLRDHLTAALAGYGSIVLISGEAGAGKTSLAEAICHEATEQGVLVLGGHCYDSLQTPYGPWVEAFSSYRRPNGGPPLPATFAKRGIIGEVGSQAVLFQQVTDFFSALAATRTVIVVLEDLHWADAGSLDVLRVVARAVARLPFMILATYRGDEVVRAHPLTALVPTLVREVRAERVDLRPLDDAAVSALIERRYHMPEGDTDRLVAYLHRRAEGNALFVREFLRALEESGVLRHERGAWMLGDLAATPLPTALRQVVDVRLTRLGEATEAALAIAAVIGQEMPLAIWAAVAEMDVEALSALVERASAARLVEETPDGTRVRFGHALIREAVYAGVPPSRRRRLHRLIAEEFAARPQPDLDAVAYHYREAGDERAVSWLIRAGKRAERTYAFLTGADRYREAAALLAQRDPVEAGWLLVSTAWLRRWADVPESIATLVEAERLARAAGDPLLTASVLHYRGILRCRMGDYHRGLAELREGVAGLDQLHAMDDGARLVAIAADNPRKVPGYLSSPVMWLAFGGHLHEAIAVGEAVIAGVPDALAVPNLDASSLGNLLFGLGLAYGDLGRIDDAQAAYAHARRIFSSTTNNIPGVAQSAWHEVSWLLIPYMTETAEEQETLAAMADAAWVQASGALPSDDPPQLARLPIMALRGEWEAAWEVGRMVRATGGHMEHRFVGIATLAALARHRGEADLAWALIRDWLPAGATTAPGTVRFHDTLELQRLAAALALDQHDLVVARAWLEAHDRWLAWSGAALGRADGCLGWAEYHRAAGQSARAREHTEDALASAMQPRQPLALVAAHRLLGELDTEAGHHAEATAHLDAAFVLAEACGAPYERALTLAAKAALCAAQGLRDPAASRLADAEAILAALGASPAFARVREARARLKMVAPTSPTHPDGLTRREIDVVRAIAAGMSNREIAAALSISVRTVNRHIENLYRKIDARGKADATAYALRHHLA